MCVCVCVCVCVYVCMCVCVCVSVCVWLCACDVKSVIKLKYRKHWLLSTGAYRCGRKEIDA